MPIATRTFRVFVSSTFEDLKEERNALQRDVFPKLRKLCEQHGARFQAIDLRWGVRDEAALDQQTMEICLREIERCQRTGIKPNFVVLLGTRYGWQPLPSRIEAKELESLLAAVSEEDRRSLVWQEGQPGADKGWYRLDENAVLPEYVLRPRELQVSAEASKEEEQAARDQEAKAWTTIENRLREILLSAIARLGWAADDPRRIKYEASATHQEILAGLGKTEADRQHVFGFFRRASGEADGRLEDLKAQLRTLLPGNIVEFSPDHMSRLCREVLVRLGRVIKSEVKRFEDRPALDLEVEAHDRFAEERFRIIAGRERVLKTFADYIRGTERRPLVLHGESGTGKSAVMAKASQQYKGSGRVIRRFIGASPESASGHALLTSLCREIEPGETPVDYAQLEKTFKERLSMANAEQPLVLFIDALDQLAPSDPAREVTWLPPELPLHVKVVISTTEDGERLPEGLPVRLERMAQTEGGQALDELLREARRMLQPWQREKVLAHFERCGLPLYLKLAAEESRLWKSYASENACTLGEGVAGVIDTLFDRLASNANHGPVLVERSLGYLAAARYGLTEDEVLDVLTEDDTVWNDFNERKHHEVSERRLPVVVWSRLSLDLEPYLTERAAPGGTVMTFYHRQLAERVAGRFLAGAESQARHANLARYFAAKPAWLDRERKVPDARRAVELVFQQRSAEQWSEAEASLFDSQFLFAKVGAGMALDLDSEYQALLQEAPEHALQWCKALGLIQGALRLSMDVVAKDPSQFASQMVGRLLTDRRAPTEAKGWSGRLARTLGLKQSERPNPVVQKFLGSVVQAAPRPWLQPLHAALHPPGTPLLRTLSGHSGGVSGVAVIGDGRRAVSASNDKTLKVWDLETGRELRTLSGHSHTISGVAVSEDGRRAVSASYDQTLKVWDLETGQELATLYGHSDVVNGVAVSEDGRRAVSAGWDQTLKVWDLETGREIRTLYGHSDVVNGVAVSGDGRRAVSASFDRTLEVWDLETGRELRTLSGHSS